LEKYAANKQFIADPRLIPPQETPKETSWLGLFSKSPPKPTKEQILLEELRINLLNEQQAQWNLDFQDVDSIDSTNQLEQLQRAALAEKRERAESKREPRPHPSHCSLPRI
jgi:hypothetical protein